MFNVRVAEIMSRSVKTNRDSYKLGFYGHCEILILLVSANAAVNFLNFTKFIFGLFNPVRYIRYINTNNCISNIHKLAITTVYDFSFSAIVDMPPNLLKMFSMISIYQVVNVFKGSKILVLGLWKCIGHLAPFYFSFFSCWNHCNH